MSRAFVLTAVICLFAAPALAQKKGSAAKGAGAESHGHAEPAGKDGMPSREEIQKSDLPKYAKCSFQCARPMEECMEKCKENGRCIATCSSTYLECAQRCGGPIGTDPEGG